MARDTSGIINRQFNGKKYLLTRQFDYKFEAEQYAKELRKRGYLVRVVKTNMTKKYHVYRRARR